MTELEKKIKDVFEKSLEGSKKDICDKAVECSFKLASQLQIKPTKELVVFISELCISSFHDGLMKGIVATCNVFSIDEVKTVIEMERDNDRNGQKNI